MSVRPQLLDVDALAGEHAKIVTVRREQVEILRTAKDEGELRSAPPLSKALAHTNLLLSRCWLLRSPCPKQPTTL